MMAKDDPKLPASQAARAQIDAAPVERLRAMIGDKQEETVEILRSWLEEKGENA
jgi:flagellar M-ring protein FliF